MADTSGVLARLQAALSVYDPTWDVTAGSATYKILEAVAQEIANANNNSVLQTYSYNVNTKSGTELDAFCNLFGVYRQLGKRATGTVTFYTTGTKSSITTIPMGTQVAVPIGGNNNTSAIYFATMAPAIITAGSVSTDVPVVAVLPGAVANVPAGTITTMVSSLLNVTSINNNSAITGGTDPESDSQLRNRWTNTAFNNTTGTFGKYVVTALQDQNVSRANAIGQQNYWDEQCQIQATVSGGTTNGVTLIMVAYSGMTNLATGSGITTPTVITSSGFTAQSLGSAVASGITSMISTSAPGYNIVASAYPAANTVSGGFTITLNGPSPYRLMLGSGTSIPGAGAISTSGVITVSGTKYWEWIQSANPDVGVSGTASYVNSYVTSSNGYVFPQGNELVGSGLNTSSQIVYANASDYYYPTSSSIPLPLTVSIPNAQAYQSLFVGSNVELISEYCPESSRSTTLASGNYVDIFIDGSTAATFQEQAVFNPSFTISGTNATAYLNTSNYVVASGTSAAALASVSGDYYIPLNQQPLINFPGQLRASTSGVADSFNLYNVALGTSVNVPIALNPYPYITFTGAIPSGATNNPTNFIPVVNANTFLYPGLALASGYATSTSGGNYYYISSVSSSGITLNNNITGVYATASNIAISGKAMAYPLYDVTTNSNSVLSIAGIAIDSTTPPTGWPALPTGLSYVTYTHDYNKDVTDVEALVQQSRPIGINTLVHQVSYVNLVVNLTVVLAPGVSQTYAQSTMNNALSNYFSGFGYAQLVSFAGIATQVLNSSSTLNVRVNSVNIVSEDGTVQSTKTSDFNLASNQLPSLYNVAVTYKGVSNF